MKTDKPLILISNDDGYNAKGILELIGCLADLGEIVVMDQDQVPLVRLLQNTLLNIKKLKENRI